MPSHYKKMTKGDLPASGGMSKSQLIKYRNKLRKKVKKARDEKYAQDDTAAARYIRKHKDRLTAGTITVGAGAIRASKMEKTYKKKKEETVEEMRRKRKKKMSVEERHKRSRKKFKRN